MPKRKLRKPVNRKKAMVEKIDPKMLEDFLVSFEEEIHPEIREVDRRRAEAMVRAKDIIIY